LQTLYCSSCPLLTTIPQIEGLQTLYCPNCPLLTTIPQIEGLQTLDCFDCPLLTKIPQIEGLQTLDCSNCLLLTTIPQIEGLQTLHCNGCKWLKTDPGYIESIKKLKRLQGWFRRIILSYQLKRLTLQLIPLYYHPDAKGGYFDKLKILQYFQKF